jgi:RNA polymerase sigma-70 factor (ECF subfamily)
LTLPGHSEAISAVAESGTDDRRLLDGLRAGEEAAFAELLDRYGPSMLRVARLYVRSYAVAEEVVQETWLKVLQALEAFEGRSSLRTWIFVILGNCARRRAEREGRSVSFTALGGGDEPAVSADRFFPVSHPRWGGMWTTLVDGWEQIPDDQLLTGEAREQITAAVEALPPNYAAVFTLREIEGWDGNEVATLLGISPENQRVLLHRARNRIRAALEEYFERSNR